MAEIWVFIFLFALLFLTLPIFASLACCVLIAILALTDIPSVIVAQRMFSGMDNFTLMAIPFFILAADLMRFGGISETIDRFRQGPRGVDFRRPGHGRRHGLRLLCRHLRFESGNRGSHWQPDDSGAHRGRV